jgi:hypothetical protein
MMPAFLGGLAGKPSALFCDSLEIHTEQMWSPELWEPFAERFGYRLEEFCEHLDDHPDVRYDYRKFISDTIVSNFYATFTEICHRYNAQSRVQCHGAPANLLSAYSVVDVPESEAILFEPYFSRIAASAAAMSGKPVVSAETFTCVYGFIHSGNTAPLRFWKREQVADLKLLADAVLAHGVNHIIWHGMPYNPPGGRNEFFASVHVGPDACFAGELPKFNSYLEKVSSCLKEGRTYTNLAIYLPTEDNWMLDQIPKERRTPGAGYMWEMRHVVIPPEIEGFHPLWISDEFLDRAEPVDGRIYVGDSVFSALYVDAQWLDPDALDSICRLAELGLPVVLKRRPRQPGRRKRDGYEQQLDNLRALTNVTSSIERAGITPLIEGKELPWYWARQADDLLLFFAHPLARTLTYPMTFGQSFCRRTLKRRLTIHHNNRALRVKLVFRPYQSLLLRVKRDGKIEHLDIAYQPPPPARK